MGGLVFACEDQELRPVRGEMAERTEAQERGHAPLGVPHPSKVSLPVRRAPIVRRQRLIDALTAAVEHRIAVVTAPAGYGKTTLLADFAQSRLQPVCWYALDERDRDLETFLRYILAAGQRVLPSFGADLARALIDGDAITPQAAADLLAAAVEPIQEPCLFIFDDFHLLDEAPTELLQALDGWLYRLPSHCHVILSGRTQPQLSVLPIMMVRQEVAFITADGFSFSCEEVAQLFRDVLGKEVPLDDAQHLADITEGWAAALVLLAERVRAEQTDLSLEQLRANDTLYRYIAVEQFDPLPDEVRWFLSGSAVLREMDAASLNEILAADNAQDMLDYLAQRNLLLRRAAQGVRYHRLFRAFLVSYLRNNDHQRFLDLNLRAGALREKAGDWGEAVYHYIQARAWERIVAIADQVGWRFFEEGRWDTLADWMDAIPPGELSRQPKLLLWKARILHYLNQVDKALSLLSQAIASFEARGEWLPLAEALMTRGMCLRVKGDYGESREALARARALLLEHDGPASVLTEARKEMGITLSLCGRLEEAIEELTAVLSTYETMGDTYNIAHTCDQLATALGLAGRLEEAATYLERARERWIRLGNDQRLSQTLLNLAVAYYLQGNYANAEETIAQGLDKARAVDGRLPETYLLVTLGDVKRDQGHLTAALDLYDQALKQAWGLDEAYIRIYTMDAIANTHRLTGDVAAAQSWAKRAMAEAETHGGSLDVGICLTTEGLLHRHAGEPKKAVASLEKAIARLKEAGADRELATAYFHLAAVYFSLKRKRSALEYLEMAAKTVSRLGYDHFLLVEATKNPLLVQYANANKIADGYYARLLKMMKAGPATVQEDEVSAGAATSSVRAYGFGQPRVEVGGREVSDLEWRSNKSKEMFFFFLCHRRPLRKEEIVAALWPDLPEEKTTSAFHSSLHRLRKALYPEAIAKDSGRYILDPRGHFTFDVEEFQRALEEAARRPRGSPEATRLMEQALELYAGPFAPDFYSEWAENLRWQLEEQYTSLLATLATVYSDAGEYKRSADLCQRILELDEYNEAAWYRLMSNYIRSGQTEAARYCYNRYAQILLRDGEEDAVPDFDALCRQIAGPRPQR